MEQENISSRHYWPKNTDQISPYRQTVLPKLIKENNTNNQIQTSPASLRYTQTSSQILCFSESSVKNSTEKVLKKKETIKSNKMLFNNGSVNMKSFWNACDEVRARLETLFKPEKSMDHSLMTLLHKLIKQIYRVMKLTKDIQNFKNRYNRNNIQYIYMVEKAGPSFGKCVDASSSTDKEKIDNLKGMIKNLGTTMTDLRRNKLLNLTSNYSISEFLKNCSKFENRLDNIKTPNKEQHKDKFKKLIYELDVLIETSKKAKKTGLLSESVDMFIESCESMKKNLHLTEGYEPSLRDEPFTGLYENYNTTSSFDDFIKSVPLKCDESYHAGTSEPTRNTTLCYSLHDLCSDCTCVQSTVYSDEPPCHDTCDTCKNEELEKTKRKVPQNKTNPHITCFNPTEKWTDTMLAHPHSANDMCEACQRIFKEELAKKQNMLAPVLKKPSPCRQCKNSSKPQPTKSNDDLGYFETNTKKIITVTRKQNTDGTIRQEKQTITIRKEKHNSDEKSLASDSLTTYSAVSYPTSVDTGASVKVTPNCSKCPNKRDNV